MRIASATLLSVLVSVAAVDASSDCYCTSSQSCWPPASTFASLNTTVGGRLISIAPINKACYPGGDPTSCQTVKNLTLVAAFRETQPGAYMMPLVENNFEADVCPLSPAPGQTCGQGAVSILGVKAATVSDVQATVNFARQNNLRLAVKNTGHDFHARSAYPGSLLLWTYNMKNITYQPAFVPATCKMVPSTTAMTVSAGDVWGDVYAAADAVGKVVVGGESRTVGAAGGFLSGGGHSPISRAYGMAVDNALEFQIVTADGQLLTANECSNSQLFWAVRGGGGGTFGVVTSVTYAAHPTPPTAIGFYSIVPSNPSNLTAVRALHDQFINMAPELDASGVSGYINLLGTSGISAQMYHVNGNATTLSAAMNPLIQFANNSAYTIAFNVAISFPTFFSAYGTSTCIVFPGTCTDPVGTSALIGSRLIPTVQFSTTQGKAALSDAINGLLTGPNAPATLLIHLVAGQAVSRVPPTANALNPAWRAALWHALFVQPISESNTTAQIDAQRALVTEQTQLFRDITPESGAYINESDLDEPSHFWNYYGVNYPLLFAVKRAYDPTGLFWCRNCVGAELFDPTGACPLVPTLRRRGQ